MRIRRSGEEPVILEFPSDADPFAIIEEGMRRIRPDAQRSEAEIAAQAERDRRFEEVMAARADKVKPEWLRERKPAYRAKRRALRKTA